MWNRLILKCVCGVFGCVLAALPAARASHAAGLDPAECPRIAGDPVLGSLPRVSVRLAHGEPVRILALGSSSTEGAGASSPRQAYPARLEADLEKLVRRSDFEVRNAGKGGETASQTVARLPALLASGHYDLVIWQVGTNDAVGAVEVDAFMRQLRAGVGLVRAAGADLVLMDQQYLDRLADPRRYEAFVDLVAREARTERVPLFSRYAMMKAWAGPKAGSLDGMLASDHFHMNDRGYACLAAGLAGSIAHEIGQATAGTI